MGKEGGVGNLIIVEVVKLYLNEVIFDIEGKIDFFKIDIVVWMGGNWYFCVKEGIFEVLKLF